MVIISNGFRRFHLAVAAAEVAARARLRLFLTGAYPLESIRRLVSRIPVSPTRIKRLLERREAVNEDLIRPFWLAESMFLGARLVAPTAEDGTSALDVLAMRLYGLQAARAVADVDGSAEIYHYRAGFGGASVATARERGMVTLCDHSLAHPRAVEFLVERGGAVPSAATDTKVGRFWSHVLADIEQADAVLANSHFVKDTFAQQGWNRSPVHVIYLGIDDDFADSIPDRRTLPGAHAGPLRLLFAGTFEARKGADVLVAALRRMEDLRWTLDVVGHIPRAAAERHADFLADPRVRVRGHVLQSALAAEMVMADVHVFPTLAEGSARVVFQALACRCYVVTTPNAGSIVEDGVHGLLVKPGSATSLEHALRRVIADREGLAAVGAANGDLIGRSYRQRHYGDNLVALYERLTTHKT